MPDTKRPTVLLLEDNPVLRELEEHILADAGFRVDVLPEGAGPLTCARQERPDVIVAHIGAAEPYQLALIDELHNTPETQAIPVVAISMVDSTAAAAQAGANVNKAIVAPFDIAALEAAVATALGNPPPAAALPRTTHLLPAGLTFAASNLVRCSREIVVRTLEQLRHKEPYRSRFSELSVGLVDDLGAILGAIVTGIQRGLTPAKVFMTPEITCRIDEHVQLRLRQGLGADAAIRENHLLQRQADVFLAGLVGQSGFTATDAGAVSRQIDSFFQALNQTIATKYQQPRGPANA